MSAAPVVQRCPYCGEQPMTRMQYALVPALRSKCRRCGGAIRLDVNRKQLTTLILVGVIGIALLVIIDATSPFVVALIPIALFAMAMDEWSWRRVPWARDDKAKREEREATTPETADR